ncbi:LUD domain-containing protein [Streptomyces lavendulocolor]|uniref:LutC/YkgG family protein n=1 Tax=Streptomyces lavendulocolor TaxID=67316 RepID=UPI0033E46229
MSSRRQMLDRIRRALDGGAGSGDVSAEAAVSRAYAHEHGDRTPAETTDLLVETLEQYKAAVHRAAPGKVPHVVARLVAEAGSGRVVVPTGLPEHVLGLVGCEVEHERPGLTAGDLDACGSVITSCALAIAETGTIVLNAGPGQGSRKLTLVPDHHVCIVRAEQIVGSVPQALVRLSPTRPLTWISGPSASSDIELNRVEGVHGPRRLDVVVVDRS